MGSEVICIHVPASARTSEVQRIKDDLAALGYQRVLVLTDGITLGAG
jgi:hypothetical protein